MSIKLRFISILVDDQQQAKAFYTEKLGFQLKVEMPMGEDVWWLTVVGADDPDGVELLLEPNGNPALNGGAQAFQRLLKDNGIAANAFQVDDIQAEYERLVALGVTFTTTPTPAGPTTYAVLDDTCGNLIQLFQMNED